MAREGFLPTTERPGIRVVALQDLVDFVETPTEAMAIIESVAAEKEPRQLTAVS